MADPIIEEIKQKIDVVDLISNYVTLKKAGSNFKGVCPFHSEKTPSFMVNRQRQTFHCFGCGETGDIFSFIQKQENIDFRNALELLAERANVKLPDRTNNKSGSVSPDLKSSLYHVNELAARFYHQVLVSHSLGAEARTYLAGRGVSNESIKNFLIGYAPQSNQALQALLKKNGFSAQILSKAGSPERFRDRIIFPLRDVIGHVVGFSGRSLHDQIPKYLNTSETELFHKNRFLYGLYEGKKTIAKVEKALLVEGQLDLVLAHQSGQSETIATSGTALTEDHLRMLRRYTDTLSLVLDNDAAGQKATERAIQLGLPYDFQLSVIVLPEGTDPGEITVKSPEVWQEALSQPKPVIDWLFDYHFPDMQHKVSSREQERIFTALFSYIKLLDTNPVAQTYQLQRLGLRLGIKDERIMIDAFRTWQGKNSKENSQPKNETSVTEGTKDTYEKNLLSLLMLHPDVLHYQSLILKEEDFEQIAYARLYSKIVSWYNKNTIKSSEQLIAFVASLLPPDRMRSLQQFLFDAESKTTEFTPEQLLEEYAFLVQVMRRRNQEAIIQIFADQIANAEAAGNRAKVTELMAHMQSQLKHKEMHAKKDS